MPYKKEVTILFSISVLLLLTLIGWSAGWGDYFFYKFLYKKEVIIKLPLDTQYVNGHFNYGQYSSYDEYGSYFLDSKPDNDILSVFKKNNIPAFLVEGIVLDQQLSCEREVMSLNGRVFRNTEDIEAYQNSFKEPDIFRAFIKVSNILYSVSNKYDFFKYNDISTESNRKQNNIIGQKYTRKYVYCIQPPFLDSSVVVAHYFPSYRLIGHSDIDWPLYTHRITKMPHLGKLPDNGVPYSKLFGEYDVTGTKIFDISPYPKLYFVVYFDIDKMWRLMRFRLNEQTFSEIQKRSISLQQNYMQIYKNKR